MYNLWGLPHVVLTLPALHRMSTLRHYSKIHGAIAANTVDQKVRLPTPSTSLLFNRVTWGHVRDSRIQMRSKNNDITLRGSAGRVAAPPP